MKLSEKIKELRTQHAYSQNEMARRAGLSLRTIQRIELDETEPRGDTLIRLAGVFGLKPNELLITETAPKGNFIPLLNLSAFTFVIFPLLGFLTPLFLWVFKKDKSKAEEVAGRKLLNFQITWNLITFSVYIFGALGKIVHMANLGLPESFMLSILTMYILNFTFIFFNIILSIKNKTLFYQPAIPFLR
ncbi:MULTISPECIES: helix-turn-helix domain-containing protein [Pedobacter]|uniref:helix-turn-helix domain-containing protein n=1 Tax=Pedobacter TaxID=84567 RepID=UPI001E3E88B3|nr:MULTISPECIES: helix-turn-helix domain-containing protein [Pedobacter]